MATACLWRVVGCVDDTERSSRVKSNSPRFFFKCPRTSSTHWLAEFTAQLRCHLLVQWKVNEEGMTTAFRERNVRRNSTPGPSMCKSGAGQSSGPIGLDRPPLPAARSEWWAIYNARRTQLIACLETCQSSMRSGWTGRPSISPTHFLRRHCFLRLHPSSQFLHVYTAPGSETQRCAREAIQQPTHSRHRRAPTVRGAVLFRTQCRGDRDDAGLVEINRRSLPGVRRTRATHPSTVCSPTKGATSGPAWSFVDASLGGRTESDN